MNTTTTRDKTRERRNVLPATAFGNGRYLLVVSLLLVVLTLFALPASAFADGNGSNGSSSPCGTSGGSASFDYSTCLPAGRWGGSIGTINGRTEAAKGLVGYMANMGSWIGRTTRLIMPNMLLSLTQLCWNSALALNQFASTFNPIQQFGAQLDRYSGQLAAYVMNGNIPSILIVAGLCSLVGAAVYGAGKTRSVIKRIVISLVCMAALILTGGAAARTGVNAHDPAKGSPWWVMQQINDTANLVTGVSANGPINRVTGNRSGGAVPSIDTSGASGSMTQSNGSNPNCQDYLYAMHDMYRQTPNSSAVVENVSTLWEETALRSWVTMQYGSLTQNDTTSKHVADNAQRAYCHVLDMTAGTNADLQTKLTNTAYGLSIGNSQGQWLFNPRGWISPLEPGVSDKGATKYESSNSIRVTRAGVFWETCGTKSKNGNDIMARAGWDKLVNNLNDSGSGELKNGDTVAKPATGGDDTQDVLGALPGDGATAFKTLTSGNRADAEINPVVTDVCRAVLTNQVYTGSGASAESINRKQAAAVGQIFDVPNLEKTWNEANMGGINNPNTPENGVRTTLDYYYGNSDVDTLGAFGSLIGAICSMIVFGFGAVMLILAKTMLMMMGVFMIASLFLNMIPVGQIGVDAMKRWSKTALNLCLVGVIYTLLTSFVVFGCQLISGATSGIPNTFLANLINGLSPMIMIGCIILFSTFIMHKGNPFRPRALLNMAGGGALAVGLTKGLRQLKRNARRGKRLANRTGKGNSTVPAGSPQQGENAAVESEQVLDESARAQAEQAGGVRSRMRSLFDGEDARKMDGRASTAGNLLHNLGGDTKQLFSDAKQSLAERHPRLAKVPGLATAYAGAKAGVRAAGRTALAGMYGAGSVVSGVKSVVKNEQVRNGAKKIGKALLTGGAMAALISNPVTLPAGVLLAGRTAFRGLRAAARQGSGLRDRIHDAAAHYRPLDSTPGDEQPVSMPDAGENGGTPAGDAPNGDGPDTSPSTSTPRMPRPMPADRQMGAPTVGNARTLDSQPAARNPYEQGRSHTRADFDGMPVEVFNPKPVEPDTGHGGTAEGERQVWNAATGKWEDARNERNTTGGAKPEAEARSSNRNTPHAHATRPHAEQPRGSRPRSTEPKSEPIAGDVTGDMVPEPPTPRTEPARPMIDIEPVNTTDSKPSFDRPHFMD